MSLASLHVRKLGIGVFLFFLAKGLVWLGLFAGAVLAAL